MNANEKLVALMRYKHRKIKKATGLCYFTKADEREILSWKDAGRVVRRIVENIREDARFDCGICPFCMKFESSICHYDCDECTYHAKGCMTSGSLYGDINDALESEGIKSICDEKHMLKILEEKMTTFNNTPYTIEMIEELEKIGVVRNEWRQRIITLYDNISTIISVGVNFDGTVTVIAEDEREAWARELDFFAFNKDKVYVIM